MSDDFLEAVQEQLQVQIAYQANRSVNTVDLKSDEAFPGLPTSTAPKVISTWKPKTSQQTERFEIPAKMLVFLTNIGQATTWKAIICQSSVQGSNEQIQIND